MLNLAVDFIFKLWYIKYELRHCLDISMDIHGLQMQDISGFSKARVKCLFLYLSLIMLLRKLSYDLRIQHSQITCNKRQFNIQKFLCIKLIHSQIFYSEKHSVSVFSIISLCVIPLRSCNSASYNHYSPDRLAFYFWKYASFGTQTGVQIN